MSKARIKLCNLWRKDEYYTFFQDLEDAFFPVLPAGMGNENKAIGAEAVFVLLVCSVENMPLTTWNGVQNA